jgi:tetratricopeptide (TPR) repeat protein
MISFRIIYAFFPLVLVACLGPNQHLLRGEEFSKNGLHTKALLEYKKAARQDPEDPGIAARIAKTENTLARMDLSVGLEQLKDHDCAAAIGSFSKAAERAPELPALEANLKKAVVCRINQGEKLVETRSFSEAMSVFQQLIERFPRLVQAKQGLNAARGAYAQDLLDQARRFEKADRVGNALIRMLRIKKLMGVYKDSVQFEMAIRSRLRRKMLYNVVIRPTKVRRSNLRPTIDFVQRLRGEKLSGGDLRADGTNVHLVLGVGIRKVNTKTKKVFLKGQKKYQSGTRPVDNQEFIALENQLEKKRAHIASSKARVASLITHRDQARQSFADAGPDEDDQALREGLLQVEARIKIISDDLKAAQASAKELSRRLALTPRLLSEPVFDTFAYRVTHWTRKLTVTLGVKATDGEGRRVFDEKSLEASVTDEDKAHRAFRRYGIKADPLGFSLSKEKLLDQALAGAAKKVVRRLLVARTQYLKTLIDRARQSSSEEETAEYYVQYLFTGEKPPEDLIQFIKNSTGFELEEVFRRDSDLIVSRCSLLGRTSR